MNDYVSFSMLILLVDDDEEEFELFCDALSAISNDAKCLHASDGAEAVKLLSDRLAILPDYIFLDINMPVMSGRECLIWISNDARLQRVPVIMYSTSSNPLEIELFKRLGASDFIVKPGSFSKLVDVIGRALNNWHLRSF